MERYTNTILNKQGKPVAGAVVTVTTYPANEPAVIYAADGGQPVESVTSDKNGLFAFYAADGHYNLSITGKGIQNSVLTDVVLNDPSNDLSWEALSADNGAEKIGGTWNGGVKARLSQLGTSAGASLIGYGSSNVGAALDALMGTDVADLRYKLVSPKFKAFGGQLRKLHASLCNPLEQLTGVVLMGDSITWGRTIPGQVFDPRNGTLADARDVFSTPTWANEVKRHIGAQFFAGAAPTLSNWSTSPSGQSTATYEKTLLLFPGQAPFTTTMAGPSVKATTAQTAAAVLGSRYLLADAGGAGNMIEVSFPFTGTEFTIIYTCISGSMNDYDLLVDGVLQGRYSTEEGRTANGFRRTHTFPYVRNKTVTIRVNRTGLSAGNRELQLEAIEVKKRCTITNQGIIGTTCSAYLAYALSGDFGPVAITPTDNFAFVQLGTNDRGRQQATNRSLPQGVLTFRQKLGEVLSKLTPLADVILMCANPAVDESTASFSFNMSEARNAIAGLAKEKGVDMIDNYAAFQGFNLALVLADGLHPNEIGHGIFARNIIRSLESA